MGQIGDSAGKRGRERENQGRIGGPYTDPYHHSQYLHTLCVRDLLKITVLLKSYDCCIIKCMYM